MLWHCIFTFLFSISLFLFQIFTFTSIFQIFTLFYLGYIHLHLYLQSGTVSGYKGEGLNYWTQCLSCKGSTEQSLSQEQLRPKAFTDLDVHQNHAGPIWPRLSQLLWWALPILGDFSHSHCQSQKCPPKTILGVDRLLLLFSSLGPIGDCSPLSHKRCLESGEGRFSSECHACSWRTTTLLNAL